MENQALIEACKRNDRKAQKLFYQKYFSMLMSVCMRYVNRREEAIEVLNDAFLKIFTKLNDFDSTNGKLESWMYRIAANTAIDHLRKEAKMKYTDDFQLMLVPDCAEDALDQLSAAEIFAFIQELPPAYRLVFNLFVIEDMTHKEIALRLEISEGTSKSNLSKARALLSHWIEKNRNYLHKSVINE